MSIDLHSKEIKTLPARTKVIRLFRRVQFRVLGMKETIEDIPLILLGDSTAKILNFNKGPLIFLFYQNSNHSFIRSILDRILQESLQNILKDSWIHRHVQILYSLQEELEIAIGSALSHPLHYFFG